MEFPIPETSGLSRAGLHWFTEKGELALTWVERGGPPVDGQPQHQGFGSLLAHRIVVGQFGGQFSHDLKPEGLTIHLSLPIEQLTT
jgi:two-component system, chemotaxis family, CheB/CheR fusion protein